MLYHRFLLLSLILYILFISCRRNGIENILHESGANRGELERILQHYSRVPEDTLKLKAAKFLILNMSGHYALDHSELQKYLNSIDSLDVTPDLRKLFETIPYRCDAKWDNFIIKEDIYNISSDYLIQHIDRCFYFWQTFCLIICTINI